MPYADDEWGRRDHQHKRAVVMLEQMEAQMAERRRRRSWWWRTWRMLCRMLRWRP
jgi:hypothetical protein